MLQQPPMLCVMKHPLKPYKYPNIFRENEKDFLGIQKAHIIIFMKRQAAPEGEEILIQGDGEEVGALNVYETAYLF